MPNSIRLPALEPGATHATVEHYYKQPGDLIETGEPLLLVVTERFEWDVPATASGTLDTIVAQPGSTVAIGATLATLTAAVNPSAAPRSDPSTERARRITPLARKIAAIHGLDLSALRGSGYGGTITQADVRAVVEDSGVTRQASGVSSPETRSQESEVRNQEPEYGNQKPETRNQKLETRSGNPKLAIPHALTAVEVDLFEVQRLIERDRARLRRRGIELTPLVYVAQAAVATIMQHRFVNSVWSDDGIIVRGRVQLGVIDQCGSARVIADAGDLSVQGLARAQGASDRAPTFTIAQTTTHWGHDLIEPLQAAHLTVGAIEQRPVVVERDGHTAIEARPLAILTLAYDARVLDQTEADAFLMTLKQRLERSRSLC